MSEDEIAVIVALWNAVGLWCIPVVAVMLGVRLYRMPQVQDSLHPRWQWATWPRWAQWGLIGVGSLAASVATGLVSGVGWTAALMAAVPVALGAIAGHKGTKAIGHTMHKAALLDDPAYEPSPFRSAASLVVPLDHRLPPLTPSTRP